MNGNETTWHISVDNNFPRPIGIMVDSSCLNGVYFLHRCSSEELFLLSHVWVIYSISVDNGKDLLGQLQVSIVSDVTLVSGNGDCHRVNKLDYQAPVELVSLGSLAEGQSVLPKEFTKYDMKKRKIKAAVVKAWGENESFYDMLDPSFKSVSNPAFRVLYNLFDAFVDMVNGEYAFHFADGWGVDQGDGNWTGFMGMLQRGECEFSFHITAFRNDRMDVTDIFCTVSTSSSLMIFLQPPTFGSYKALVVPLTLDLWLVVGLAIVIYLVLFWLVAKFDSSPDLENLGALVILTLGTLAQQGFNDSTNLVSSRILSFSLLIFSFFLYLYYNAAVLNGLLSPSPNTITTIEQLLKTKMEFGILDASYMREFDSNESHYGARDEITLKLFDRFNVYGPQYFSQDAGIERVCKGGFVFFTDSITVYIAMNKLMTDFHICSSYSMQKNQPFPVGVSARKKTPFRELINVKVAWMREVGFLIRNLDRILYTKPVCHWHQEKIQIGIEATSMAFVLLLLGMLSAVAFLLSEIIYKRVRIKRFL